MNPFVKVTVVIPNGLKAADLVRRVTDCRLTGEDAKKVQAWVNRPGSILYVNRRAPGVKPTEYRTAVEVFQPDHFFPMEVE